MIYDDIMISNNINISIFSSSGEKDKRIEYIPYIGFEGESYNATYVRISKDRVIKKIEKNHIL